MKPKFYLFLIFGFFFSTNTIAANMQIIWPWMYPVNVSANGKNPNAIVYMKLINNSPKWVKLKSASSPVAAFVEFHSHAAGVNPGSSSVSRIGDIEIPARGNKLLTPLVGEHIVLIDLNRHPLRDGDLIPLTLSFDNGEVLQVNVMVKNKSPF